MIEIARRQLGDAEASSKACGWANWKGGVKSSSAAWRWIAATIGARLWPALQHHSPAWRRGSLAALGGVIVHVLGARDQPRALLERAVGRERQPERLQIVGTAPLARYVAEHFEKLPKPYRSYRAGWVFRNEKPGPGRFRQFMQFDADTVGAPRRPRTPKCA
jgi:hypothetical protein